jgi:membrane-associated phospholipid phosphatase
MTPRLVPWPRPALWVIATSVAVVAILGALVHDRTGTNRLDNAVLRLVSDVVPHALQQLALHLTDPPLVAGLLTATALVAVLLRRWDIAALAVAAPLLAVLLTEDVLKPLVHRSNAIVTTGLSGSEALAYPSGHETGVAGLVTVLGLVLLGSRVERRRKIVLLAVLVAVLVAAAVALVGLGFHYATDTVGALGVALTVTLTVALVIDQVAAAIRSRPREPVREPA